MDFKQMLIDLIAYAQRQGCLSDSSDVYTELEQITGYDPGSIEFELF